MDMGPGVHRKKPRGRHRAPWYQQLDRYAVYTGKTLGTFRTTFIGSTALLLVFAVSASSAGNPDSLEVLPVTVSPDTRVPTSNPAVPNVPTSGNSERLPAVTPSNQWLVPVPKQSFASKSPKPSRTRERQTKPALPPQPSVSPSATETSPIQQNDPESKESGKWRSCRQNENWPTD